MITLPDNPHAKYQALFTLHQQGHIDDETWSAIEDARGEYGAACEEAQELFAHDLETAIKNWEPVPPPAIMTVKEYLAMDGLVCPICRSSENEPDGWSDELTQHVTCRTCQAHWLELATIIEYTNLYTADGKELTIPEETHD